MARLVTSRTSTTDNLVLCVPFESARDIAMQIDRQLRAAFSLIDSDFARHKLGGASAGKVSIKSRWHQGSSATIRQGA
jgi:hypothetical protein